MLNSTKKLILGILIGLGMSAGVSYALVTLPPSIKVGDLLVATSTTQFVRLPTSTLGSVLTMFNNIPTWRATSTLGISGSLTGGIEGKVARWTSATALSTGILLDNGTVAGINATSSTVSFNVQGSGTLNPFNVSSSSGTSILHITSAGNVGINTTTPGYTLSVAGNIDSTGEYSLSGQSAISYDGTAYDFAGGWFNIVKATGATEWVGDVSLLETMSVTGTSTLASTTITQLLVSSLTSGKCVQAGAGGLLTSAADACGTGGSGNSAWTIGSGLIHNATSTDEVGIGTSTPAHTLTVVGSGEINPFVVASSTGATMFQINQRAQTLASSTAGTIPGYSFFNDPDTGISNTAANTLNFSTGGTGYLTITSGGDIAIQSAAATNQFLAAGNDNVAAPDFSSNVDTDTGFAFSNTNTIKVVTGGAERARFYTLGQLTLNTTTPIATFGIQGIASGTLPSLVVASSSGTTMFQVGVNGSTTISSLGAGVVCSTAAGSLYISPCGTTALSGGTVGKVAVWSSATALTTGVLLDNGTVAGVNATSSTVTFNVQGSGVLNPFVVASSTGTGLLTVLRNGNVGIGTSNPQSILHLYSSGNTTFFLDSAQSASFMQFQSNGAAKSTIGYTTVGDDGFAFYDDSFNILNAMFTNAGRLGINTTTPTHMLTVVGKTTVDPFNVATSTGTSILQVTASSQILACATCRLTIPQGTAPTLSVAGDVGVDTSNGGILSFYANGRENLNATTTKGMLVETPTATENLTFFTTDVPITITRVTCLITSSVPAPSWTFSLPHDTNRAAASGYAASGQACTSTTTPQNITLGADLTMAANEVLYATSSAVTNASTTLIQVYFKYDN